MEFILFERYFRRDYYGKEVCVVKRCRVVFLRGFASENFQVQNRSEYVLAYGKWLSEHRGPKTLTI